MALPRNARLQIAPNGPHTFRAADGVFFEKGRVYEMDSKYVLPWAGHPDFVVEYLPDSDPPPEEKPAVAEVKAPSPAKAATRKPAVEVAPPKDEAPAVEIAADPVAVDLAGAEKKAAKPVAEKKPAVEKKPKKADKVED